MAYVQFEKYEPNDLDEMIRIYSELRDVSQLINNKLDKLQYEIKAELKNRKWESYKDDKSNISVSIVKEVKERVNRQALHILLSDEKYNQVLIKESVDKIQIVTPKDRERLKKYVKKNS